MWSREIQCHKMDKLTAGEDFYYNEDGYVVLTEKYHLKNGTCCGNGCKHCPYAFINVPEPKRGELLKAQQLKK